MGEGELAWGGVKKGQGEREGTESNLSNGGKSVIIERY